MRLLLRIPVLVIAFFLSACDPAAITRDTEPTLTPAELSGSYNLSGIGSVCDVMISGVVKEGGSFTSSQVQGTMVFGEDGRVTHEFRIVGTCAFSDGTRHGISRRYADVGTYKITGRRSIELEHHGVTCTATYKNGVLSVRTGSLFPPVRFTYSFQKQP